MSQADNPESLIKILDYLGRELEPSILIGGWGTQLRVGGEISRDIDLIINDPALRDKLKNRLSDYSENTHHAGGLKVRGKFDDIHIDAYIPHSSSLGNRLRLDVARLARYIETETINGWYLLTLEAHLTTKFAALLDRPDSEKGLKDAREIARLLDQDPSTEEVVKVLIDASSLEAQEILPLLNEVFALLPDRAGLNKAARRKIAATRREYLDWAKRLCA